MGIQLCTHVYTHPSSLVGICSVCDPTQHDEEGKHNPLLASGYMLGMLPLGSRYFYRRRMLLGYFALSLWWLRVSAQVFSASLGEC